MFSNVDLVRIIPNLQYDLFFFLTYYRIIIAFIFLPSLGKFGMQASLLDYLFIYFYFTELHLNSDKRIFRIINKPGHCNI